MNSRGSRFPLIIESFIWFNTIKGGNDIIMKQNKKVYIENDYSYFFDSAKFDNIIKLKAKEKGIKIKEYIEFIANEISNSPDTVLGWKRGKNSPVDIDMVYKLEKLLDVPHKKLLFSKEKQLEKKWVNHFFCV